MTSVSFRSNMRITTDVFLVSLVLLFRLDRGLSQRGHCTQSQCFGVFQEPKNFTDAEKWCQSHGGHLMTVASVEAHEEVKRLVRGLNSSFWIGLQLPGGKCPDAMAPLFGYRWTAGKKDTDFQNWFGVPNTTCSTKCVSVAQENEEKWWQDSCDKLNGFLCQRSFTGMCKPLPLKAGESVKYTTMDFEVSGLASYPPGAIATESPSGLKHICYSTWKPGPWACEVMNGGCEHRCVSPNQCVCPPEHKLNDNKVTCDRANPCDVCAHRCLKDGACGCNEGYTLAQDGKGCVDINECREKDRCRNKDQECVNTVGGFECVCKQGFLLEEGVCVNAEICSDCEHLMCEKINGVYQCICHLGYIVSDQDPKKCVVNCTQQCPPECIGEDCTCRDGYIKDVTNNGTICVDIDECVSSDYCDQVCRNTNGSYICSCDQGFVLHSNGYDCMLSEEKDSEEKDSKEKGSGSTTPHYSSTKNGIRPTAIPAYVKTGSVLGIVVFVALCLSLLYFLVHRAQKRCGTFERSLRSADFDIVHLQQVTTEKYKRLSFDKQFKNDVQRQRSDC